MQQELNPDRLIVGEIRPDVSLVRLNINNMDHIAAMYNTRTHPDVDKYLNGDPPKNPLEHIKYLDRQRYRKRFYIIQTEKDLTGYCQMSEEDKYIELGWALHPFYQGLGIGAEAVNLLVSESKRYIKDNKMKKAIILFVREDNLRAIKLYTRVGFLAASKKNGIILMELANDKTKNVSNTFHIF